MNIRIFCFAVGLTAAGTWAQVPIFKIWATEVYEVNPDGTFTAKCGETNCPTQDLLAGIAQPGDLINIEVTVEGWDASTDSGECDPQGEPCGVSAQDCALSHCAGSQTSAACMRDSDCVTPDTCDLDTCEKAPLLGAYQWTIDSSTYSNGGAGPSFAPAQLSCTSDADCACAYTEIPGIFNDCADFAKLGFCTCAGAWCDETVCDPRAAAYIDSSSLKNFVFRGHRFPPNIFPVVPDYEVFAFSSDPNIGGVPEALFRCAAGSHAICNVDADCPSGTCELAATSPYYLGTLLLEVTGESCGLFTLDLLRESTYLQETDGNILPAPIVEPLTIDIAPDVPCHGDPCWEPPTGCFFDNCMGTPIDCGPGKTCVLGFCLDCTLDDLTDATWADADPPAIDPVDRPRNCAIDAREPHSIGDVTEKEGWDRLILQFSCDPTELAATLRLAQRFTVQTDPVEVSPPAILFEEFEINAVDRTLTIPLDRSITPGFYTCISQVDSGNQWCAGYLPADASQDGLTASHDINGLINAINFVPGLELPIYATDINRSGLMTGADILRLIDLLNGAGDFDAWITRSLPDCPSTP